VLRPDVLQRYWPRLLECSRTVPMRHQELFAALRTAVEPPTAAQTRGFAGEIITRVREGTALAAKDPQGASRVLAECEERLRKRWWPFGKGPAWVALVQAWSELDRGAGLQRLHRLPAAVQKNLLQRLNDTSPLTAEQWDLAHRSAGVFGSAVPVITDLLDRDKPRLQLPDKLARTVGDGLRMAFNRQPQATDNAREVDNERKRAASRYLKLVGCLAESAPATATALLEKVFAETAVTPRFAQQWPDRFSTLRQLLNEWSFYPTLRETVPAFLAKSTPAHMRDFCLAQWHAMTCSNREEAQSAWRSVEQAAADKTTAEAWFLVTLVRRQLGAEAMELARASSKANSLVPRLRRTWLCEHPESAATAFSAEDFASDVIGQFLFLGSPQQRMEFLRERTNRGRGVLPEAMWDRRTLRDLVGVASAAKLMRWYTKNEPERNQFGEYLRLHGYGDYCYEDVDPYLLRALVAWDDEHPSEAASAVRIMWDGIRVQDSELSYDLVRDAMFSRCQAVLCARPESYCDLFITWLKRTLVDSQVRRHEGNMIYTFSLKGFVPFLYCLLGAQAVARCSARRCDELLTRALRDYTLDADLMPGAAELYATDKGLAALTPPAPLPADYQEPWQFGVVDAAMPRVLDFLVQGMPKA
jgi:hypothetical protein